MAAGVLFYFDDDQIAPAPESASVVRVIDGDTIVVELEDDTRTKVRLSGIDTPEYTKCYAAEATRWLRTKLPKGTVVDLVDDTGQADTDKYDRLLRYVELDGQDLGRRALATGHARLYTKGAAARSDRRAENQKATNQAQADKQGLWKSCAQ